MYVEKQASCWTTMGRPTVRGLAGMTYGLAGRLLDHGRTDGPTYLSLLPEVNVTWLDDG